MLGDIPLDDMMAMRPFVTPFAFIAFCITVVFTVFTILIAIISDAYEDVIDDKEGQRLDEEDPGAVALLLRTVGGWTGHYKKTTREEIFEEKDEEEEEEEED